MTLGRSGISRHGKIIALAQHLDDGGISRHGVSLLSGGSGRLDTRLDTPPSIKRRHPDSRMAQVATSMSSAGGMFHDARRLGANASASNRSLILISE
jgi:hypothetical protein